MVIRTTVVMATLMIVIIEIIRVILIVEMIMDCHGTSFKELNWIRQGHQFVFTSNCNCFVVCGSRTKDGSKNCLLWNDLKR